MAIRDNAIYFLEGREDEAFEAFMERYGGKVVSYHVLSMARKCFGVGRKEGRSRFHK